MGILEIKVAKRAGVRLVFAFVGTTGSGKTTTGLNFGIGLALRQPRKVGILDLENGRGKLGADECPVEYLHADLLPPFSPARHIQAIKEFQDAGVEVLIIDSASHWWEGIGGCQEIAEAKSSIMPDWITGKREHKRLLNALLACDMHVILCIRAREKIKPEKVDNKTKFVSYGLQPVCEKDLMFDVTASVMVHDLGHSQDILKVPGPLMPYLGRKKDRITIEDGEAVRRWADGASTDTNAGVERARNAMRLACQDGMASLGQAWADLGPAMQHKLGAEFKEQCKASAQAMDAHNRAQQTGDAGAEEGTSALADRFASLESGPDGRKDEPDQNPKDPPTKVSETAEKAEPRHEPAPEKKEPEAKAAEKPAAKPAPVAAKPEPKQEPKPAPKPAAKPMPAAEDEDLF